MSDPVTPPPPGGGDHRSAKAEAKGAKAHAKAMRPWYKKKRFILPLILLVLIVGGVAASGGGSEDDDSTTDVAAEDSGGDEANNEDSGIQSSSGNESNPPQDDITGTECVTDDIGFMTAKVNVTNNSSERSNYIIEVTFENSDGSMQLGTGGAIINGLEPGQSAAEEASALEEAPPEGFTCRVTDVNRMAG